MSDFHLKIESGPTPGKRIDLAQKEHFLGRDDNNTIVINDEEISRSHCRLLYEDTGFEIEDIGSTNGTYVNGKRITGRHKLNDGDVIRLGDNVSLVYKMLVEAATKVNFSDQVTLNQPNEDVENKPPFVLEPSPTPEPSAPPEPSQTPKQSPTPAPVQPLTPEPSPTPAPTLVQSPAPPKRAWKIQQPKPAMPAKPEKRERRERKEKKRPNFLLLSCSIVLVIGICIFIGSWIYIDTYAPEYYCYFLPFLPGCP